MDTGVFCVGPNGQIDIQACANGSLHFGLFFVAFNEGCLGITSGLKCSSL